MALVDVQCRSAQPKEKPYKMFDGGGLYLEVHPNKGRYWRYRYTYFRKEKRLSLGVYPKISLQQARLERDELAKLVAKGIDPALQKQEEKQLAQYKANQTFELVAREWHTRYYSNWTPRHASHILHRLAQDVFPQLGHYPVANITPPLIVQCVQKIENRNAHDLARRALQMIGQVFRYAVSTGRAERDMTADLKGILKRYKKGHHACINVDELPDLVKAIDRNETRLFRQTVLAIQLMLLTFVRTNELIGAQWEEVDFKKATWTIPAERMKMRTAHIVPLSKQALAILEELRQLNSKRQFVFPSIPRPRQPMSNATILGGLKRLGYKDRMTGHGFRALAMSTIKEKLGYRHEVVDRQLAHLPRSKIDQAYDRASFINERTIMMQQWANLIDEFKNKIM